MGSDKRELTKEERQQARAFFWATAYDTSTKDLNKMVECAGITPEKAQELLDKFTKSYHAVAKWRERVRKQASFSERYRTDPTRR